MFMVNHLAGFGVGGSSTPLTRTFVARTNSGGVGSYASITYSGASIGTAASNRMVVVCVGCRNNTGTGISGVTIGGNAATQIVKSPSSSSEEPCVAIYALMVPSGTTANIVVTANSAFYDGAIAVYAVYGRSSVTEVDSDSAEQAASSAALAITLNVPAGGVGIACTLGNDPATSFTWVGFTEDNDASFNSNPTFSCASLESTAGSAGLTVSADPAGTPTQHNICGATWGPE